MTNMAATAASPIQGVSTCGIVRPFLMGLWVGTGSVRSGQRPVGWW
jgi:hypothetical protein